ncbi:GFA family protein [Pyruvatibacter sp.]|uniref:GFA family protein n=1 Tax=Pyruvatibacter sp. TaxID=1981328 RepID=UPI0032EC8A59
MPHQHAHFKINTPEIPLKGGCQCGAVRYTISGPPVVFYLCHCTECQKQTSSAFGESLRVNLGDFTIEGPTKVFLRPISKGGHQTCTFCDACGTRLTHQRPGYGDKLNVKAGTLDDTSWLVPAGHIWVASKQPHITIRDDELAYAHQPESDAALEARWQAMTPMWHPAS